MKGLIVKDRESLTKAEKKICDYLESYLNNSIYMTVTEIANNCGVGEATVTRFCKKLGFRSFLEFRMTVAQEYNNSNYETQNSNNKELEIQKGDSVEAVTIKFFENSIIGLENTIKSKINYDVLNKVIDLIKEGKKVTFIGVGYSGILAEQLSYKLMHIGINATFFRESHTIAMAVSLMHKEEVLFVISDSGERVELNKAVEIAQKKGITIIALTQNLISKLSRLSNYIINYDASISKIQQTFLIDLIYLNILNSNLNIFEKNKKITLDAVAEIEKR